MTRPARRDRMRPVELIGLSAALGIFTGFIVVMSTREANLGLIWGLVVFVASLVITAMLVLAVKPKKDEIADIEELNSSQ